MKSRPRRIYLNMCKSGKGLKIILITIVIISFVCGCMELFREKEKTETSLPFLETAQQLVMEPYLPGIRRMCEGSRRMSGDSFFLKGLLSQYPGLLFAWENGEESVMESDYGKIFLSEGSDEDHKGLPEEALDYGDDAMHLEKTWNPLF